MMTEDRKLQLTAENSHYRTKCSGYVFIGSPGCCCLDRIWGQREEDLLGRAQVMVDLVIMGWRPVRGNFQTYSSLVMERKKGSRMNGANEWLVFYS